MSNQNLYTRYAEIYPDVGMSHLSPKSHYELIGKKILNRSIPEENTSENSGLSYILDDHLLDFDFNDKVVELDPVNQLNSLGSDHWWTSEGEDPHFFVKMYTMDAMHAGWYIINLNIDVDDIEDRKSFGKLYLDTGAGFSESETIIMRYDSGQNVTRVLHVTRPLVAIRFDPLEADCIFKINSFAIEKVSEDAAAKFMLEQISTEYPKYKGLSKGDIVSNIMSTSIGSYGNQYALYLEEVYDEMLLEGSAIIGYGDWINKVERKSIPDTIEILDKIESFLRLPVFSIVIPTYKTPIVYLKKCIDSILSQSYPFWELCIADDASGDEALEDCLNEYMAQDSRIQVVFRKENGHISAATNSAIEISNGDFIVLVDHDDELADEALFFLAEAINKNPQVKIIYSDEDKVDTEGNRFDPHFKSDWNPDLLYCHNYVTHLSAYYKPIIDTIGGIRLGVEGSQDYDLILRASKQVDKEEILHIPRILYHWRAIEGSTALASVESKSYTLDAGYKALTNYFSDYPDPKPIVTQSGLSNFYKVDWPIPVPHPMVSIIIPTRDYADVLKVAVDSILEKTLYNNYEIIIVNNGSVEPETLDYFSTVTAENDNVHVFDYDQPFNYSAINNYGVQYCKGDIVGLVNNDVEVINGEWLTEIVMHVCRPDIGCVGGKLLYDDDSVQHAGIILGIGGIAGHAHRFFHKDEMGYANRASLTQDVSAVTGACLFVKRSHFEAVGGLNETQLAVAYNDVDFCLKVRELGVRNLYTPYALLYHFESKSRGYEDSPEKVARLKREGEYMMGFWGEKLTKDPFYNVNLTLAREDFSLGSTKL